MFLAPVLRKQLAELVKQCLAIDALALHIFEPLIPYRLATLLPDQCIVILIKLNFLHATRL